MRRSHHSLLVLAFAALVVGGPAAASAAPDGPDRVRSARPVQDPELPCDVSYTRTVEPHQIVVNETVHVHVEVNGSCESSSRGVDMFFVVDRTITMQEEGYLDATKEALKNFVNRMDFTKSNAGLISFALTDQVNRVLTNDRDSLIQSINAIRLVQETDVRGLQQGFRAATQHLDQNGLPENDKLIVVLVAGQDSTQALIDMPSITQAAINAGVRVVFLMFPNAQFVHYVQASSDCDLAICPTWQGPRGGTMKKWAWGVNAANVDSVLQMVANAVVAPIGVTLIQINEAMDPGAEMIESSIQPPPDRFVGAPYRDSFWEYADFPAGGITIDYDARMVYPDETYPATVASVLTLQFNTGEVPTDIDLPNPLITVLGEAPTPTSVTATASPTTDATTPTPPTSTPTPTDVATTSVPPGGDRRIFLPVTLMKGAL